MGVPMLMAGGYVAPPPPAGVNYNFTINPVLPTGVTYRRPGAPQGIRDASGNYVLAEADQVPWAYSAGVLQGIFYRQTARPLANLLEHDNYNPTDLAGFDGTNCLRVLTGGALNPGWSEFPFITSVHGIDGTSTSDNQNVFPSNPVGQGNPLTAVGFATAISSPSVSTSHRCFLTDVGADILIDYAQTPANTANFGTGSGTQLDATPRYRMQSRSRSATTPQYVGHCVYAGTIAGLDELDIAWGRTAILQAPELDLDVPDGTYNPGDMEIDHDGGTTVSTQTVVVSGGVYSLDLADFGLTSIDNLSAFRAGDSTPVAQPVTFDLTQGVPLGIAYAAPYRQIKRDATGETFLADVGGQEPNFDYLGSPQGLLIEKRHTNKLGYPNVAPFGGSGFTVVDDTANVGQWSGVLPGNQVMDISGDYFSQALGNTQIHSFHCIGRRLDSSGSTNSILTINPANSPIRSITRQSDLGSQRLSAVTPDADTDRALLRNTDQGLRAALLTVVQDEQPPLFPIYDETGTSDAGDQMITVQSTAYVDGQYDITLTFGDNTTATLQGQDLSGNVNFVAEKTQQNGVYDLADFGVARTVKSIQRIQFNLPGQDPGPDPTPPPTGQLFVLRGIGIREGAANQDVVDSPAWTRLSQYPAIRYIHVFTSWRIWEPVEGQFDTSHYERLEEKARANNVLLFPSLQFHGFHANTGGFDPLLVAPDWVATPNPANFSRFGGGSYPGFFQAAQRNTYRSRRWDKELADAHERATVALMEYISGRPEYVGLVGMESAVGSIQPGSGGDDWDALEFWNRQNQLNIAAAGARSGVQNFYFNLNWATGLDQDTYLNLWYDTLVEHKLGVIQNDPQLPSSGKFTGSNYDVPGSEVIARKEVPACNKGEIDGSGNDWQTMTSKGGDTFSHRRFHEYLSGGPGADPGHQGCLCAAIADYVPSGPSDRDDWYDWFDNPSHDVSYWRGYRDAPNEFIDK